MACGILVPQPGIEPRPGRKAQSFNHCTARELPPACVFKPHLDILLVGRTVTKQHGLF